MTTSRQRAPLTEQRGADLYRYYDANDVLLYVGASINSVARLSKHKSVCPAWFKLWAKMTRQQFGTRTEANAAEIAAIKNEKPLYNITHNNNRKVVSEEEKQQIKRERVHKWAEARKHAIEQQAEVERKERLRNGSRFPPVSDLARYNMSMAAKARVARLGK